MNIDSGFSRAFSLVLTGATTEVDQKEIGMVHHTCISGYVWREAFEGDLVCVTPAVRDLVRKENAEGPQHVAN